MKTFKTPILFLIFNRPDETKKVFERIKEIKPKFLYIAADGPRKQREEEAELCDKVKKVVEIIDWDCQIQRLYRKENLGCKEAVSKGIIWFFENVEQGIILEDDCLPDISFFTYCEELLNRYKDDDRIISIGGTNLGHEFRNKNSYSFSRFMNMWGWATWRRSANLVEYDMDKWRRITFKNLFLFQKLHLNIFNIDLNWISYWKNYFNLTVSGKVDTWDYQWIFTQMYYQKVSIFPAENLIKNIGFSDTATHTFFPEDPIAQFESTSLSFPLSHPSKIIIDEVYEMNFIKKIWLSYKKQSAYTVMRSCILQNAVKLFEKSKQTSLRK